MASYDAIQRTVSSDPGSVTAAPNGISSTAAAGGPFQPQKLAFWLPAGAGGSADDAVTYTIPSKMLLLQADFLITTGVSMKTLTLRTAAAGGGSALSSAMACDTTGNLVSSTGATAAGTALAAGTLIVARRSDSGVAGCLVLTIIPTA